jgi:hypothetical protein
LPLPTTEPRPYCHYTEPTVLAVHYTEPTVVAVHYTEPTVLTVCFEGQSNDPRFSKGRSAPATVALRTTCQNTLAIQ